MTSLVVALQLAGAVALLLHGLKLVQGGITDALGPRLKLALRAGTRSLPRAMASGLVATLGLQSSTATALLVAGFAARNLIAPAAAQVVLLGANVGTALTAWIVSLGIEVLSAPLILAGAILSSKRGIGRALTGAGLMLLSVTLLGAAAEPLRTSPQVAAFLPLLDQTWPVALVFAAGLALLCSSSLAAVVLIASLGLPHDLAAVLVLGANVGGAVPAVLAGWPEGAAARRVTLGNLIVRGVGAAAALAFVGPVVAWLDRAPLGGFSSLAVEVHVLFNLALASVAWPFAAPLSRWLTQAVPEAPGQSEDAGPRWLHDAALQTPLVALAGASREALALGDIVEEMLDLVRAGFRSGDLEALDRIAALEARVDRRQTEIKTYLSHLGREAGPEDRQQAAAILDHVINLEHVGDIIERNLLPAVRKKAAHGLRLTDEGFGEIERLFRMTAETMRTAQTVFLTRDRALARSLIEDKVSIRNFERASAKRHLDRLSAGEPAARETSSLHLDLLRDLKRINAHLAAVAHPILNEIGLLAESRLRSDPD